LRCCGAPLNFDPAWLFGCGTDALLAVAAGLAGMPAEGCVVARTRADYLGEGGADIGSLIVLSTLRCDRKRVTCRVQVGSYRLAAEIGERPMALADRTILASTQPSEVLTLAGAGLLATSRGREWCSIVSTWIQADCTLENRSLILPTSSIEHSGASTSCTLTFDRPSAVANGRRRRR
jgi:hypothetical protein